MSSKPFITLLLSILFIGFIFSACKKDGNQKVSILGKWTLVKAEVYQKISTSVYDTTMVGLKPDSNYLDFKNDILVQRGHYVTDAEGGIDKGWGIYKYQLSGKSITFYTQSTSPSSSGYVKFFAGYSGWLPYAEFQEEVTQLSSNSLIIKISAPNTATLSRSEIETDYYIKK